MADASGFPIFAFCVSLFSSCSGVSFSGFGGAYYGVTSGLGYQGTSYGIRPDGLAMHDSGNFMLLSEDVVYSGRLRLISMNRAPHIEYVLPRSVSAGTAITLTLTGFSLGLTAAQVTAVTYGP